MNKFAVISHEVPQICDTLTSLEYKLIRTDSVDGFISYEKNHADMQIINIDGKIFVLSACKTLCNSLKNSGFNFDITTNDFTGKYPNNILLNAKKIGSKIIGKIKHLDSTLLDFCTQNDYNLINVNQGYTACSCVNIADKAVITTDPSIYKVLCDSGIDVLKISQKVIRLHGAGEKAEGFIGGASVTLDNNSVLFFGDITKHPDYTKIFDFCTKYDVDIKYIENLELTDIGGAILLNI